MFRFRRVSAPIDVSWLAVLAVAVALFAASAAAQSNGEESPDAAAPAAEEIAETDSPAAAIPGADNRQRTQLNLLGEVDAKSGEGRRNENVRLTLIDNNVLKELNTRMGTTATTFASFDVERGYFGAEFGGSASTAMHVAPTQGAQTHGELFWTHSNSVFSARSFFQAGQVQPARTNDYGASLQTALGSRTFLTLDASQRKLRGQVNGNVLVPSADERTPTTRDPAAIAIIEAIFGAFPAELPNRTDINPRALNTNAPQNIDNDRLGATLDRDFGDSDHLTMKYGLTLQDVDAFQLVGGQNPDTTTKNHQARITWSRSWNPSTTTDFSLGYERIGSLLVPEETSLGPFYLFGSLMQSIGPGDEIPIDRAQNMFRYAGRASRLRGNHNWKFGFDLLRRQVNGFESNNHRGTFSFRQDFGRNTVENLLEGTASAYRLAIGSSHRGFRNWDLKFFLGDEWRVSSRLSLTYGARYEPVTRPSEVDGLSDVPYDCDCNNWAPRFGFAYKAHDRWGVFRGAYGLQYGEIFPATYMQTRFNTPGVLLITVQKPDLANPLRDLTEEDLGPSARSNLFRVDPELATPYSHLYDFTWEMRPYQNWVLELGYVGSRSHKLLQAWYMNRARNLDGVESTTENVNERRPDQRYFDILHTVNASRAYYDAGKATLRVPRWAGLTVEASYWFSKAIDLGSSYTNTAFGRDGRNARSPTELNVHGQMKGPSDFDQSHAGLWTVNYETPQAHSAPRWLQGLFGGWQVSSIVLLKTGTPFAVRTSDGPGFGNVDGAGSDRPNLLDPSVLGNKIDHPDTSRQKLPFEAFGPVGDGELTGNLGANTFRKDGVFNINSALSRRFFLGSDRSLLFRVESLNLLNHAQFEEPGYDLSGKNFGQITNTLNDGRAFRFSLRLSL